MNHKLHQILEEDTTTIFQKGYTYLNSTLLPAIAQVKGSADATLLSDIHCTIGDIHDFIGAPKQAIKYYQQAIQFDKKNPMAYQEMANSLAQIGRYFEAFQAINLAIEFDPNNTELLAEKEEYQDDMNYDVEPIFTKKNQIWTWYELLAEHQFNTVIEQVLKMKNKDIDSLKCLNRAYGALEKNGLYLDIWNRIKALDIDFEMDYGDWFYMPRGIYGMEEMVVLRRDSIFED